MRANHSVTASVYLMSAATAAQLATVAVPLATVGSHSLHISAHALRDYMGVRYVDAMLIC